MLDVWGARSGQREYRRSDSWRQDGTWNSLDADPDRLNDKVCRCRVLIMIIERKSDTPYSTVTIEVDEALKAASVRLLENAKGSDGGFQRMTMGDALCIASTIRGSRESR